MKRHLTRHKSFRVAISTVLTAITAVSLAACSNDGSSGSESDGSTASSNAASATVAADGLPIDARPSSDASDSTPCPYLDNQDMADLNGQRVTGVSVDKRFNPPACQWLSYGNTPQAQTIIRTAKNEQAAIDMISAAITHPGTTDDAATITRIQTIPSAVAMLNTPTNRRGGKDIELKRKMRQCTQFTRAQWWLLSTLTKPRP